MTAMMGLRTRLVLAQTLAWTGLLETPAELAEVVRQLVAGHADLVLIWQPDARDDDLAQGYRAARAVLDGRVILGLAGDAQTAGQVQADVFAADAAERPRAAHDWGLTVAVAGDSAGLQQAMAAAEVDAIVVGLELTAEAARLAPPAEPTSKPWFTRVTDLTGAERAIAAGARRLAFQSPTSSAVFGPQAAVSQLRDLLTPLWRSELVGITFGALQADSAPAQPRNPAGQKGAPGPE